jgi:hypothetical protein
LETFFDRRVEIRDGLTANSTTHQMQSEGVVIAIISTIIPAVVATTIVIAAVAVVAVAVGAFRNPLLGLLVPNVDVVIFDGIARCDSFGRDTPSATDAGGPLDG